MDRIDLLNELDKMRTTEEDVERMLAKYIGTLDWQSFAPKEHHEFILCGLEELLGDTIKHATKLKALIDYVVSEKADCCEL